MIRARAKLNPRVKNLADMFMPTKDAIADGLEEMGIEFRKQERRIFSSEGSSGGGRWQSLSPSYAKRKRRLRPGRKILVWDGDLRKSLTRRGGEHIQRSYRSRRWVLSVGTSNRVAEYHETGGGNLPRRSFMDRPRRKELALLAAVRRGFVPHIMRAVRVLKAAGDALK